MHAALVTLLCWAMAGAACFIPTGGVLVPAALAVLVALVGLPHGAADHRFAKPLLQPILGAAWLPSFLVGYLVIALLVTAGWFLAPAATTVLFFLASAWHFGQEEPQIAVGPHPLRPLLRFARGGLVVWTPLVFHGGEVTRLLRITAPRSFETQIQLAVEMMTLASWCLLTIAIAAWGLQILAAIAAAGRTRQVLLLDSTMQASFVLLFAVASPIFGFLVYFCAWHSARGLKRLRRELGESWPKLAASLAPMTFGAIGLIGLGATASLQSLTWDETLVRSTFVGLSAVAVPHIVLHGIAPMLAAFGDRRTARPLTLADTA
ncbi:Brp/Blh family beta-carotene 15,15'-dioxygenase [Botrimarina sp.]|uniref:Brp/Blh family beta-carotene 15,15'-dioxygenase n=1 Tax=Botrimarina sp. TaxID=2795802 RepID=UPI0032ED940A